MRPSSGRCRNTWTSARSSRAAGAQRTISNTGSLVRQYHGGSAVRQFVFVLASSNLYGEDVLTNISNSGFFERLEDWMRVQTKRRALPQLPGSRMAQKLEAISTGYLYNATATEAHYQIQCRLTYYQKGEH